MGSSIEEVDKAITRINRGKDKKDEMRIMMAPYAKWDDFLAPAPMTIALLGQLILVSADSDFSLSGYKKTETNFKLLRYDSFRACLVQVTNEGWGAFDKAHTNMDQIRLLSGNVEGHVRNAVNFLVKGTPAEIELILPDALKSIENIADQCVVLASSVEEEFVNVMNVVGELLEACTDAKGAHEEELKKTQIAIEVAKESKKALEEEKKEAEANRKDMMKKMKEAEDEYKEAMDNVPGAGELMGLAFADCFINVVKKVSDFIPSAVNNSSKETGGQPRASRSGKKSESSQGNMIKEASSFVSKIETQVMLIGELALGNKKDKKKQPSWNKIGERNGAEKIKQKIRSLEKDMPKTAPEIKEQFINLIQSGVDICEKLLKLRGSMQRSEEDVEEVMELARNLSSDVAIVSSGLESPLGGNSLSNKSPHQAQQDVPQEVKDDDSLMKSALQSARFKTETAKQNLSETRKLYDESCKKFDEKMQRMGGVLAELAAYQPKKLDLETIRLTLIRGITALGELREQWGKLVKFFHMLSNLVKCCLESSLKQFVTTSKSQKKLTDLGMEMSDTMRDALYEQAFKANQIAYVVNGIAEAYTEVSENHLMDRMNCLGTLLSLDPVADKQKIIQKRAELDRGCKEAQQAIKAIANRKKREIDEAFDKRIGRIEREVEAIMPPMKKAEMNEIDKKVKTAMSIRKAAIETNIDDLV